MHFLGDGCEYQQLPVIRIGTSMVRGFDKHGWRDVVDDSLTFAILQDLTLHCFTSTRDIQALSHVEDSELPVSKYPQRQLYLVRPE